MSLTQVARYFEERGYVVTRSPTIEGASRARHAPALLAEGPGDQWDLVFHHARTLRAPDVVDAFACAVDCDARASVVSTAGYSPEARRWAARLGVALVEWSAIAAADADAARRTEEALAQAELAALPDAPPAAAAVEDPALRGLAEIVAIVDAALAEPPVEDSETPLEPPLALDEPVARLLAFLDAPYVPPAPEVHEEAGVLAFFDAPFELPVPLAEIWEDVERVSAPAEPATFVTDVPVEVVADEPELLAFLDAPFELPEDPEAAFVALLDALAHGDAPPVESLADDEAALPDATFEVSASEPEPAAAPAPEPVPAPVPCPDVALEPAPAVAPPEPVAVAFEIVEDVPEVIPAGAEPLVALVPASPLPWPLPPPGERAPEAPAAEAAVLLATGEAFLNGSAARLAELRRALDETGASSFGEHADVDEAGKSAWLARLAAKDASAE